MRSARLRLLVAGALALTAAIGVSSVETPAARATVTPPIGLDQSITFVTPIWESAAPGNSTVDLAVLEEMKTTLRGTSASAKTRLGWSFSAWGMARDIKGAAADYAFDPTYLDYQLGLAVTTGLPVLIHLNMGRWADCCAYPQKREEAPFNPALLNHIAGHTYTGGEGTTARNSGQGSLFQLTSANPLVSGRNYFSLTRKNTFYRGYKKRNLQAASAAIATWAAAHPDLFVGVSLDSETFMPDNGLGDYNPLFVAEWKEWMQGTGIYGPGGEFAGQGRQPALTSVAAFNTASGTSFTTWADVTPPTAPQVTTARWLEWNRWRVTVNQHAVSDMTDWITAAGIDRNLVYGHQTPELRIDEWADDLQTSTAGNGASGYTSYSSNVDNFEMYDAVMRGTGKSNFGLFELNPSSSSKAANRAVLDQLWADGVHVLCPNEWTSQHEPRANYSLSMKYSPDYGSAFSQATAEFIAANASTPRRVQPRPDDPGTLVYDFYDNFSSATKTGPDNHLEPAGSVGGHATRSIYQHVGFGLPSQIIYTVALPSVSGNERLNLQFLVGVKDGAVLTPTTGPNIAHITVMDNGSNHNLLGDGLVLQKLDWQWHRYHPGTVDLTSFAGRTVGIMFRTFDGGSPTYGWTMWGAPAIYKTGSPTNVALNRPVSASSSTEVAGWGAAYLTDGNVDGGLGATNGWASASASTPTGATPWATVDLGSDKAIGKVALWPRSDMAPMGTSYANGSGTGFPSGFTVQTSLNGTSWTTVTTQTSYPEVQAGHPEVITFPPVTARYVRVQATTMRGTAGETGYRFTLAELGIYPG